MNEIFKRDEPRMHAEERKKSSFFNRAYNDESAGSIGARTRLGKQRGISMVIVLFLLIALSVLAFSMMNLSGSQHFSSLYTARGAQAYFAARSGMEYALGSLAVPDPVAACNAIDGTDVPVQLAGFTVALTCAPSAEINEGITAAPYRIYTLTATAAGGNLQVPDRAYRRIEARARFPGVGG